MKNQILLLVISLISSQFIYSQVENRSDRKWNESNQTTYYIGETDEGSTQWRSDTYPVSDVNNPDSDSWNEAINHRSQAIWSDNSSIVSDEKTGYHAYIPYPYVSADDILWAKRLKKLVDVRISQNHPIYFPVQVRYDRLREDGSGGLKNEVLSGLDARKNLYQILKDAATTINPATGQPLISVYNSSLTRKLSSDEISGTSSVDGPVPGAFQENDIQRTTDEFGDIIDQIQTVREIEATEIVGYYIEEELFFDKRRSKLDYRYISITPLIASTDADGLYTGFGLSVKELPTFYFPEIRQLLANHKVFPLDGNMAQRISFDEFFSQKTFCFICVKGN
jgi:hypothetical protein